jgi:hypothetical protein
MAAPVIQPKLPTFNEIVEDLPITVTVTTTKQRLIGETRAYKWVMSYLVRVRSMGTATYIALGNEADQQIRLTAVGQSIAYNCNRYEFIDLAKKYVISDTSDAVIEVIATSLPVKQYGSVNMADR